MISDERDIMLTSMEEHNVELTKAFEKLRLIKSTKHDGPKIDEDGKIDTETFQSLNDLYFLHKEALLNIVVCAGSLKKDILDVEKYFGIGGEKKERIKITRKSPMLYTQENIRDVFYKLINPSVLGTVVFEGNVLEKNDLVGNFKIDNGILYGDISDKDNNIYTSSIDMNLLQYKQNIFESIQNKNMSLENVLNVLNDLKIEIIPKSLYKLKCTCLCNKKNLPCRHNIALYFRFIDNIKINKNIVIELFGIKL